MALPHPRVHVPAVDVPDRGRRDLGRERLGPLLGLGPQGDVGVHHLGRPTPPTLHARATAGWKAKAAVIALIAFGASSFNYVGVNIFITGLHSTPES